MYLSYAVCCSCESVCVRESLDTIGFCFLDFVRFAFFFFRALSGFVIVTRGRGVSASGDVIKTNAPRKHMAEKGSERMMSSIFLDRLWALNDLVKNDRPKLFWAVAFHPFHCSCVQHRAAFTPVSIPCRKQHFVG